MIFKFCLFSSMEGCHRRFSTCADASMSPGFQMSLYKPFYVVLICHLAWSCSQSQFLLFLSLAYKLYFCMCDLALMTNRYRQMGCFCRRVQRMLCIIVGNQFVNALQPTRERRARSQVLSGNCKDECATGEGRPSW